MKEVLVSRDLFLKIMDFEPINRTLKWDFGYWGGTINRWYKEGLYEVKGLAEKVTYGGSVYGQGAPWPQDSVDEGAIRDFNLKNYFGFDEGFSTIKYNYWIYPKYKKKIFFENEKYMELSDTDGIRKRILKDNSSMPLWINWPVKSRKDWEQVKEERFNLDSINKRYTEDIENIIKEAKDRTFPLGIMNIPIGFFGSIRSLIGQENLFILYYDEPLLIKDILNHLCKLWVLIAEELTSKIDFDVAFFWEDMAGKNGSLISPTTFREFMLPCYRRLIDFLKSKGIKYFIVDTDGNVNELIPLFLEVGVNVMYPFEQQAKNDLIEIRKKYPKLRMIGGFDKNVLYKGKSSIDKELEKMSCLISQGGYIPFADHLIPPNTSWKNFKYYRRRLNYIINSTKIL